MRSSFLTADLDHYALIAADSAGLADAAAGELIALANRATPDAIRVQKALFEEWLNLPFQRAVESSKEALALAFEGGEPQRIARERLGRKP
jgi:hypothetical protein